MPRILYVSLFIRSVTLLARVTDLQLLFLLRQTTASASGFATMGSASSSARLDSSTSSTTSSHTSRSAPNPNSSAFFSFPDFPSFHLDFPLVVLFAFHTLFVRAHKKFTFAHAMALLEFALFDFLGPREMMRFAVPSLDSAIAPGSFTSTPLSRALGMAMDLVDGAAAGGGSGDIATHLWTFLDRLSPAMYNRLYASPASCLSIFRCAYFLASQPLPVPRDKKLTGWRYLPHLTTTSFTRSQAAPP